MLSNRLVSAICLSTLRGVMSTVRRSSQYAAKLKLMSESRPPAAWIASQAESTQWQSKFAEDGYLVIKDILNGEELEVYREIYQKLMSGEIDSSAHRHDLGSHVKQSRPDQENVCQIMWPSEYVTDLQEGPLHQRTLAASRLLLGDDVGFDFDMLIAKAPETNTPTPWHQDESYWPNMPDKRAASFWVAMEETTLDNGCMWFVPGSHLKPLRAHRPAGEGAHILQCDASEDEGIPEPLASGSCTIHHGRTLHYSRGNTTKTTRRGFITNFRPEAMVLWEREHGFDHGRKGLNQMDYSTAGDVYKTAGATKLPQKTAKTTPT